MGTRLWIYQRPLWPKFTYNKGEIQNLVSTIREKMDALSIRIANPEGAQNKAIAADIVSSSAIEDEYHHTAEDVLGFIKSKHAADMTGIYLDAIKNYRDPITEARLLKWHGLLFADRNVSFKTGEWRNVDVGVGDGFRMMYMAPSHTIIQKEMVKFIEHLNENKECELIKAAMYPLYFLISHPFPDGNGRISRCLMTYFL